MARIPLLRDDEADPRTKQFWEGCEELIGRVPDSMRLYGRLPKIAAWFLPFLVSLQREGAGGVLDGRTKELVVLTTSFTNACEYCATHNTALGLATGLTEEEIGALDESDPIASPVFGDRDRAVVRWVQAVTRNTADRDKEAFAQLERHFDEDAIMEITWLCAMFNMINRVHDSLLLEVEPLAEVDRIRRSAHVPASAVRAYAERMAAVMDEED